MPTPEHLYQLSIPITQDKSYDVNIDDGIQQQKFNTNRIQVQNSNGPSCISQTALYSYHVRLTCSTFPRIQRYKRYRDNQIHDM